MKDRSIPQRYFSNCSVHPMPRGQSQFRRSLIVTAYVTAIAVLIVLLPARFTTPVRVVFTEVVAGAEGLVFETAGDALATTGTLRDAIVVQEKNRLAEKKARELASKNDRLREMLLALRRRLKDQEKLPLRADFFTPVAARVVSYDTRSMRKSLVISAGGAEGLDEGIAVTSEGALIGTVSEVGHWFSRVRLITDPGNRTSCRVQRNRSLCIVKGTGDQECSIEWLEREAKVENGDVLVTSPVEEELSARPKIPAGLPVGAVTDVRPGRIQPLFQDVNAVPRLNLERVETVQVLRPRRKQAKKNTPAE